MDSLVQDVPRQPRLQVVDVRGDVLRPYTKNRQQRAVLDLVPGEEVVFVRGSIRPAQILGMRDSYVNAVLIQSRGFLCGTPCDSCQNKMLCDQDSYAYPFAYCKRLPGHFSGCCGNCKWPDHAARCTQRDEVAGDFVRAEPWVDPVGLIEGAGHLEDPIEIKEEDEEAPFIVVDDDEAGASSENPMVLD